MTERRFHPADLVAFAKGLVLASRAQRVETLPLSEVVSEMRRSSGSPGRLSEERLDRAAIRATSRWARWGRGRDTCLIRSLVLGALLADRGDVVLHVGFRPGEDRPDPDGHAWITLDGRPVGNDGALVAGEYSRLLQLSFSEGGVQR